MTPWHKAPRAEDGILCMVCQRRRLCHEVENMGVICKDCFGQARECKHKGCEGLATKATDWECRAHYVGEYDELHVDDFGGFKRSSLSGCEECGGKRIGTGGEFLDKLRASMIKNGIPTRLERQGSEYCLLKEEL